MTHTILLTCQKVLETSRNTLSRHNSTIVIIFCDTQAKKHTLHNIYIIIILQTGSGVHVDVTDKEVNSGDYYWGKSTAIDSVLNK